MPSKNIIFVALDGVRLDFIENSKEFRKIKQKGTLFKTVITYAPHSIASFHAIFTGIYGNHNGVNSYFGTSDFRSSECKTLTEYFRQKSYYCFGDSMNNLIVPKEGFDRLVEQEAFKEFADNHEQMIREVKHRNEKGQVCFLHLHCSYAHNDVVEKFIKEFKKNEEEFYKNKERNIRTYKKSVKRVELYLERIMKLFDEYQLWDNSTIVFFSDHGTSIGEKKGERAYGTFCYEYSVKTFLLFIDRNIFPVKEVLQMVRTIDLLPTMLELRGLEADNRYREPDGESLLEYVGKEKVKERVAFIETGGMEGPWPSPKEPNIHCIRTNDWKLIYNRTPRTYELYNLKKDQEEKNNVITTETMKAKELKKMLMEYVIL